MLTEKLSPNQNPNLALDEIIEIIKINELELLAALRSTPIESDDEQCLDELPNLEN